VEAGGHRQIRLVGSAEGSHYSQGHYRTYFGLGASDRVDRIIVTWPDGTQEILEDVESNMLVTLNKGSVKDSLIPE
jgi:hypothetical protein